MSALTYVTASLARVVILEDGARGYRRRDLRLAVKQGIGKNGHKSPRTDFICKRYEKKFRRKVVEASSLVIPRSNFFFISVTGEPVDDPFQPRGPGGRAGGGGGELQHVQN